MFKITKYPPLSR